MRLLALVVGLAAALAAAPAHSRCLDHCTSGHVYIGTEDGKLLLWDIDQQKVVETHKLGQGPILLVASPKGDRIFANDTMGGIIYAYDPSSRTLGPGRNFGSELGDTPATMVTSPDGTELWFPGVHSHWVASVDASLTGSVTTYAAQPGQLTPFISAAVWIPGVNNRFISTEAIAFAGHGSEVSRLGFIDLGFFGFSYFSHTNLPGVFEGGQAAGAALIPDEQILLVSYFHNDQLFALRSNNGQSIGVKTTLRLPLGVAVKPGTHQAWVADHLAMAVQVFDVHKQAGKAVFDDKGGIRVCSYPHTVVFPPAGNQAWTVCNQAISYLDTKHLLATTSWGIEPITVSAVWGQ